MRNALVLLAALVAASWLTASPVLAGNADPTGAQLKAVVEDYLARAPGDDTKVPILEKALNAPAGATSNELWADVLCVVEIATSIGLAIWDYRGKHDACRSETTLRGGFSYCMYYSQYCDHWRWQPDCLTKYGCR